MSEAEGDKNWKAAKKLTSASFLSFRLKSNWEEAAPLYEKAANSYRQAKAWDKAREAFEMAATCQQHQQSPWHAAKHLERAGECAKETSDMSLMVDFMKRASSCYRESGRPQSAADCLTKAAKWSEASSPEIASEMLEEAVEEVEIEGKAGLAGDLYRQAIALYIRREKYAEAVGMLLKFAAACESGQAIASQCKSYLSAIVVWLYACDGKQAWAVYQDALEVDAFSRSEEAFAAEDLLEAYKLGDKQAITKSISKHAIFRDLDNQVARLTKHLPQGVVEEIAASMGGVVSLKVEGRESRMTIEDLDEDDLT